MKGFLDFIRTQGVVGLAVGFLLGGAVSQLVQALINDIINPLLSIVLGAAKGYETAVFHIGSAQISWGHFVNIVIQFIVIALVVYFGVRILKLDRIDKKKE